MIQEEKSKICYYFLQGRCKFGESCRYSHYIIQCFLMRHAESVFNVVSNSSPFDFYSQQAKHDYQLNPDLIDCEITEEAIKTMQNLNFPLAMKIQGVAEVDVIFVSPLVRALETVMQLINNQQVRCQKVVVLPNLTEVMSKICDLSGPISPKIQKYNMFDFSQFTSMDVSRWQDLLVNEQLWSCIDEAKTGAERYLSILGNIFPEPLETSQKCFNRCLRVVEQIREISQKNSYSRALIVSHNRVLKYISGRSQGGKTKRYNNCEIREEWL